MGEEDENSEEYKRTKILLEPDLISHKIISQKYLQKKFRSRIEDIKKYQDHELGDGTIVEDEALNFY